MKMDSACSLYSHQMTTYFIAPIDQSLVVDLFEDPPNSLHEGWVHGAVVVVKVNPPSKPTHDFLNIQGK